LDREALAAAPGRGARSGLSGTADAPQLVGHKLLALSEAAARDFADVYVLAHRSGKDVLLARGAQIDAGFDAKVLADMFATLDRTTDDEIPVPDGSSPAEDQPH
jgi:hypothetical protein